MAERKLNINAPLLSAKRYSGKSVRTHRENNQKLINNCVPDRQHSLPSSTPDIMFDQVTEPVAVPFDWEQIPGKCKGGGGRIQPVKEASITPSPRLSSRKSSNVRKQPSEQFVPLSPNVPSKKSLNAKEQHSEGASITPRVRLPARNSSDATRQSSEQSSITPSPRVPTGKPSNATKQPSERESKATYKLNSSNKANSFSNYVGNLNCKNDRKDEKGIANVGDDDDVYSDAPETLSHVESSSLNCSITGVSGADISNVKQLATFCSDPNARDFMMNRLLPAAKAMTLEAPQYASRKQSVATEQPREVKTLVKVEKRPSLNQYPSHAIPCHDQNREESEDEDEEYDLTNISSKGCGLFPRLCLRNSMSMLIPLPGMKMKKQLPTSSTSEVVKPSKGSNLHSHSQSIKNAWNTINRKKSHSGANSPDFQEVRNKGISKSNKFSYSGELQTLGRSSPFRRTTAVGVSPCRSRAPQSPFRAVKLLGGPKEAENCNRKSVTGAASPDLQEVKSNWNSESKRFYSGELQIPGKLSPFRRSSGAGASPVPSRKPQPPFQVVRSFAGSKDEYLKPDKLVFSNKGSGSLQGELSQEVKRGLHIVPAIEKTLYINKVLTSEKSCSNSSSMIISRKMISVGKECKALQERGGTEETAISKSHSQDTRPQNISNLRSMLDSEVLGFTNDTSCQKSQEIVNGGGILDQGCNREQMSSENIEDTVGGNLNVKTGHIVADGDSGDAHDGSFQSPLPPPLPKSPSESWLWRTLPLVSLKAPFSRSGQGTQCRSKEQDSHTASTDTKWETIVKTSNLHHDHARFSEELASSGGDESRYVFQVFF